MFDWGSHRFGRILTLGIMTVAVNQILPADLAGQGDSTGAFLRAGFARVAITPGQDLSVFGYDFRQRHLQPGNRGVLHPLHVQTLVVEDSNYEKLVLASLDVAVIPTEIARRWRAEIAEALEMPAANVILSATHTHSAPLLADAQQARAWEMEGADGQEPPEVTWAEYVRKQVLESAHLANGLKYPVQPWVIQAPLGIAFDRRVHREDGSIAVCWEPQQFPDRVPELAVDPTLSLLEFRQTNGDRRYLLWNVGAHPVVLGKTSKVISSDFPGVANAMIEERVAGARSLFVNGACGHNQPWLSTQEDPKAVEIVAEACASFVTLLRGGAQPVASEGQIAVASETLSLANVELDVTVAQIGGVVLATVPAELFGELAITLRNRIEAPLLLATLTQGWEGYLPHEAAFEEGAYEVEIGKRVGYEPGDGEKLVDHLIGMVESLAE